MAIVELTSGRKFEARDDESLLDAAARSGVSLSYSCKTGRCSSCKCKLLRGETGLLQPEVGLTADEQADGWILGCVRFAVNDIVLEAEDICGFSLPEEKILPCRISEIVLVAPDVVRVLLRFPPNSTFHFFPGQYVNVIGSGGVRRSYSLANADFKNKTLELHIRNVEGGAMSRYWFGQAKVNDLLRICGPLGTFFVRKFNGLDLVFLATGTGIAPVKSILESIHNLPQIEKPRSVHVFWGARTVSDLYLNFMDVVKEYQYTPVLSRSDNRWKGAVGYVQNVFLQNESSDLRNTVVYACGSDRMIHDAKKALEESGLEAKNFHSDAFVSSTDIN
ncbi:FAD-binding oxidoreductase [Comamonas terrigena]|uniref:FAD-binding oxidoreductase n=1 Tax=Comamonas terrigena TaxID=32013 RepID=UPI002448A552|nr:FAD-binding oxidoreductase [Comamonas terrigena]MDH1289698.1 FAD-binding oxidoreductase [Comamonas terrigena]